MRFALVKSASLLFCEELNGAGPREISATEISPQYDSSYLRGRQGRRLTGQVGQAESAEKKQNKNSSAISACSAVEKQDKN